MDTKHIVRSTLAALALIATSQGALAKGPDSGSSPARASIEGTCRVSIQPYFCNTGEPVPVAPFESILSFGLGGTLQEAPSMARFAPGQRATGERMK